MNGPRPRHRSGVAHTTEDGSLALYDAAGLRLLVLDPVGAGVWTLADGSRTDEDILEEVVAAFGVSRDAARADIENFLGKLREAALIEDV